MSTAFCGERKPLGQGHLNQKQTQPTYGVNAGSQTGVTLMGGGQHDLYIVNVPIYSCNIIFVDDVTKLYDLAHKGEQETTRTKGFIISFFICIACIIKILLEFCT